MRPATRPQYHRLQRILEMIREGTRTGCLPNCGHFIRELEVSRRSLMRDLDFLRDDHHAPIAYDDSRKGFQLTDPTFSLPPVQLTRREVSGKASGAQLGAGRRGSESGQGREAQNLALKARGRIDLANITHHVSGVVGSLTEDREGNKRSIGLLPILHSAFFVLHSSDCPHTAWLAARRPREDGGRRWNEECRIQRPVMPGHA